MAKSDKGMAFLLHSDSRTQIEFLSDESAGRLLKAILAMISGEKPDLSSDREANIMFLHLFAQYERDRDAYEAKLKRLRANGKKGGRPRKEQPKQKPVQYPEYPDGDPYAT